MQWVASLIADPGVMISIPARPYTFVEIDNDILLSKFILNLIQEGDVSYKRKYVH